MALPGFEKDLPGKRPSLPQGCGGHLTSSGASATRWTMTIASDTPPAVTLGALFLGFLKMGISGFGGVLPWARRIVVEERKWLTPHEFTELLGLCQFLPGPNVVNLSVCVGARFRGVAGSLTAFAGLMLPPLAVVLCLGELYMRYGQLEVVHAALRGIAAAAAG